MKAPELPQILVELPNLVNTGGLPDAKTLELLFQYEFGVLKLRDSIRDFEERIRYDSDNSRLQDDRLKKLVLLSLILEDKKLLREIVDFKTRVDGDHKDYQRYYLSISKNELGDVSYEKSARNIKRSMSSLFREMDAAVAGIYEKRLEEYLYGPI